LDFVRPLVCVSSTDQATVLAFENGKETVFYICYGSVTLFKMEQKSISSGIMSYSNLVINT